MKDEIVKTLTELERSMEQYEEGDELGNEMAVAGIQLLADTCTHGKAAAGEAAESAEAAARCAMEAFIAAQNAAKSGGVSTSGSSAPRRPRSRPLSGKSTKAPPPNTQETADGSPASGTYDSKNDHSESRKSPASKEEENEDGSPSARRGSGSRPGSGGPRARNDALLQRRVQTLEDIRRLNGEVVELQKKMEKMLKNNPLLVPSVTPKQKRQVFTVLSEFLEDFLTELGNLSSVSTQDLNRKIKYELLTWLQLEQESGVLKNALGDSRTGLLRFAAVIDKESLTSLLKERFLARVLATRSDVEPYIRDMISRFTEGLHKWIINPVA
jgi:hypothetical protein